MKTLNNKNCKIIIKILSGIIFLILCIIFIDYYCFNSFEHTGKTYINEYKKNNKTDKELNQKYIYDNAKTGKFKKIQNESSDLKAVVLFGFPGICGFQLDNDNNLSYYIGKLTKRPVYNRVKTESSPNHMYYQLSNEDFYKIITKAEYVFYFYIPKQIVQTSNKVEFCPHDIYYHIQNKKLTRYKKIPLNKKSYITTRIDKFLYTHDKFKNIYLQKNKKLFKTLLLESKQEAQNHWGNINFVIVCFKHPEDKFEEKIIEDLKKEGFEVFELYKYINLKDKKYKNKNKKCYNSLLWEETAKVLAKEYEL